MTALPQLKSLLTESAAGTVVIHRRALERTHLADEDGSLAALLKLLRAGDLDNAGLAKAMADKGFTVTPDDIAGVLKEFDSWRILQQADGDSTLPAATQRRYQSNLRFYDIFADLQRTSADQHRAIESAHVLMLGAGGVGSGVLQSLVGLGVGRVTLVDFDVVEEKNLARQFAYGQATVGKRKVEAARDWAHAYSSGTVVEAVHRRVDDVEAIRRLAAGTDVVVCGIDSPDNIQMLINEACHDLGIPFVAGGVAYSTMVYWSVQPRQSPCRLCLEMHRAEQTLPDTDELFDRDRVNRAIGPVVQILCGLMSMEVMRLLTGAELPVALACYHVLELADGMRWERHPWQHHPECPLCRP
jgi:molybdopterin-synthase adenylyltransferase